MTQPKLRSEDLKIMYDHAAREFPNECCGIIIGRPGSPGDNEVRPCANIQNELKERYPDLYRRDADTGYFIDPTEMVSIFNEAGKRKLDVVGFYHSHPNHAAFWSQEDHRAAMWAGTGEPSYPGTFHVVVSVYDGEVKDAAMFVWDEEEKQFVRRDVTS